MLGQFLSDYDNANFDEKVILVLNLVVLSFVKDDNLLHAQINIFLEHN